MSKRKTPNQEIGTGAHLVDVSLDLVHVELELAEVRQRGEVSRPAERRRGGVGEEDGGGHGADEEGGGVLRECVTFAICIFLDFCLFTLTSHFTHFHEIYTSAKVK